MSEPAWVQTHERGVFLKIHLQPGAKRTEIAGVFGDSLKIRLQAPPVEGKANTELLRFLAKRLGCRRSDLQITSGELSREKRIFVTGGVLQSVVTAIGLT